MARDAELPPPLEMVCLTVLWRLGEGNVADVRRVAGVDKPLAYTTVLTLLERLTRRGAVIRRKEGRSYRYRPAVERSELRLRAMKQFLGCYFDGSIEDLREFLASPGLSPSTPEPPAEHAFAAHSS